MRLIGPRYPATADTTCSHGALARAESAAKAMITPAMPMTMLVRGPADAMKSSAFADGGSRVRLATPPSMKRVMDETVI
jgi:hypothetical protein